VPQCPDKNLSPARTRPARQVGPATTRAGPDPAAGPVVGHVRVVVSPVEVPSCRRANDLGVVQHDRSFSLARVGTSWAPAGTEAAPAAQIRAPLRHACAGKQRLALHRSRPPLSRPEQASAAADFPATRQFATYLGAPGAAYHHDLSPEEHVCAVKATHAVERTVPCRAAAQAAGDPGSTACIYGRAGRLLSDVYDQQREEWGGEPHDEDFCPQGRCNPPHRQLLLLPGLPRRLSMNDRAGAEVCEAPARPPLPRRPPWAMFAQRARAAQTRRSS
jgi:hypothetical protein